MNIDERDMLYRGSKVQLTINYNGTDQQMLYLLAQAYREGYEFQLICIEGSYAGSIGQYIAMQPGLDDYVAVTVPYLLEQLTEYHGKHLVRIDCVWNDAGTIVHPPGKEETIGSGICNTKGFVLRSLEFNRDLARQMVEDVADDMMAKSFGPGLENHPAFTLGHIGTAINKVTEALGGQEELPEQWMELFARKGPGDPTLPEPDTGQYPCKPELLQVLERQQEAVAALVSGMSEAQWNSPYQWRFSNYMPKLGDMVSFMCCTHTAMHLSQLSAWRRRAGLPPALNRVDDLKNVHTDIK